MDSCFILELSQVGWGGTTKCGLFCFASDFEMKRSLGVYSKNLKYIMKIWWET